MTPTSLASSIPPHHFQQQGVGVATAATAATAAPPPPPPVKLSFDDIAKLFNLPIAEAAVILGVCTSVLKRICRKNGIERWPYRKFLAGKSVEDIKRDAVRERTKNLPDVSKASNQRFDVQNLTSSTSVGLPSKPSSVTPVIGSFGNQVLNRTSVFAHETSKLQRGASIPGQVLQPQDNNHLQYKWPNTAQYNPLRNVPSYMDEFKYGFPGKSLASISMKWWGSSNNEGTGRALPGESITEEAETEKKESCGSSNETAMCMTESDQTESNLEGSVPIAKPTDRLCSVRKKAAQCGHDYLKVGISKSSTRKMSKKQKLLLVKVFKSSLPDQWKDVHS